MLWELLLAGAPHRLQWPIAIRSIAELALRQQLLQLLEQLVEHATAQRRPAAHAFPAGDQNAQLSAALELQQHLHGYSRTAWHDCQRGVALVQPGEGADIAWVQLLKHQPQLPIVRYSSENGFQAGQALQIKRVQLCLFQRAMGYVLNRVGQIWLTITPAVARKMHSPTR